MKRRIIGIFLTIIMIAGIIPIWNIDVFALEDYITDPYNGAITSGADKTVVLDFDGTIAVSENVTIFASVTQSAIRIAENRKVVILIQDGVTLTVYGGDANGTIGAGAGIEVPASSELTIAGKGSLDARGGKAAAGENGNDGGNGSVTEDPDWCYSGAGGDGGAGGGGGGAGIGGKGGNGGAGGNGGTGLSRKADTSVDCSGYSGQNGYSGLGGALCGKVYKCETVTVHAVGGSSPDIISCGGDYGDEGHHEWYFHYMAFGGGGGGSGGSGYPGADIGSGGSGGSGGGGGGSGITKHWYSDDDYYACFGVGGAGRGGNGYVPGSDGKSHDVSNTEGYMPGSGGNGGSIGYDGTEQNPNVIYSVPFPEVYNLNVYDGTQCSGVRNDYADRYVLSGSLKATNAGTYTVIATLADGFCWEDGTLEPKEVYWKIAKATVPVPPDEIRHYTGKSITVFNDTELYRVTDGGTATEIGDYYAKLLLRDDINYQWEGLSERSVYVHYSIHAFADINGDGKCDECNGVYYLDKSVNADNTVSVSELISPAACKVKSDMESWGVYGFDTWYIADEDITLTVRPKIKGRVHLILMDGVTLNASCGINLESNETLYIYAQSEGENAGKLIATGEGYGAGIGRDKSGYYINPQKTTTYTGGTLYIHGGDITAVGCENGAGIGGYGSTRNGGGYTYIFGGTVTAVGGKFGAGIGGGGIVCTSTGGGDGAQQGGIGGTTDIYAGTVIATGGYRGAGIGGGGTEVGENMATSGKRGAGGITNIYGGSVTANGGSEADGIGWGGGDSGEDEIKVFHGTTNICGGNVTVFGGKSNSAVSGALTIAPKNVPVIKTGVDVLSAQTVEKYENERYLSVHCHSSVVYIEPEHHKCIECDELLPHFDNFGDGVCICEYDTLADAFDISYLTRSVGEDYSVTSSQAVCAFARRVTAEDTVWGIEGKTVWYVADDSVSLTNRPEVIGDVRLILVNGKTLTANKGITLEIGNSLTVYSQSDEETVMGKLVGSGVSGNAAIGGVGYLYGADLGRNGKNGHDSGELIWNGGYLVLSTDKNVCIGGGRGEGGGASSDLYSFSCGRGGNGGNCGNITFCGGIVKLSGKAGIGGGDGANGGYSYTEAGNQQGNGGKGGDCGSVNFFGGITVFDCNDHCIGGGNGGNGSEGGSGTFTNYGGNGGSGGKILYAGGTVTLQSESAPCISGGKCGYGCNNDPANVGADAVITVCGSPIMKSGENSEDANFTVGYNNENYFHVHYHADSDENCFCDVCGTFLGSDHIVISLGAQIKTETSSLRLGAFYNGIILDDEQREAVKNLGMIFYPKHLLGEDILDLNNTNAVSMSATAIEEFEEDKVFADYETFTFYVTIVGIPSNGYNTKIAFRPFIILGDGTIEYGEVMERCYNDVVNKQSQ